MTDYISREAVLRRMQKIATEAWKMQLKANVETVWNEAQDVIRFFPAADVRPVVLCKDCKCYRQSSFVDKHMECSRSGFPVHSIDFCSFGEKMEES